MWAEDCYASEDIADSFRRDYNMENYDGDFDNEVEVALGLLDTEMKQLFLRIKYGED